MQLEVFQIKNLVELRDECWVTGSLSARCRNLNCQHFSIANRKTLEKCISDNGNVHDFSEGRSSFKQTTLYYKVFLLVKDIILGNGAIHGHTTCTSMYVNVALKVVSLIWSSGYHRVPQHIRALPPSWYHGHLEALATSLAAPTKSNWMQPLQHLVYHHLHSFTIIYHQCYPMLALCQKPFAE